MESTVLMRVWGGQRAVYRAAWAVVSRTQAILLAALVLTSGSTSAGGCTEDLLPAVPVAPAARSEAAGAERQIIHIDPDTGAWLDRPPRQDTPTAPEAPSGPVDIPVTIRPDGTVVAEVGDRFRSELRAEIVDGVLVTCHAARTRDGSKAVQAPSTDGAGVEGDR